MKQCTKCNIEKPLSEYRKQKRSKDGLAHWCKLCADKATTKCLNSNRKHHNEIRIKRRKGLITQMRQYKSDKGCQICHEKCYACLDIHHLNADEKDLEPAVAAQVSWKRFLNEVKNCIVVCRNCHSKIHAGFLKI